MFHTDIFSQYLFTSWSLLLLSPFDWHERGKGLSSKGNNRAGLISIILQKLLIVEVTLHCFIVLSTVVRRWKTMVICSDAVVLHLKL